MQAESTEGTQHIETEYTGVFGQKWDEVWSETKKNNNNNNDNNNDNKTLNEKQKL